MPVLCSACRHVQVILYQVYLLLAGRLEAHWEGIHFFYALFAPSCSKDPSNRTIPPRSFLRPARPLLRERSVTSVWRDQTGGRMPAESEGLVPDHSKTRWKAYCNQKYASHSTNLSPLRQKHSFTRVTSSVGLVGRPPWATTSLSTVSNQGNSRQTDPVQSVAKFHIVPVSVIVPNTAPPGRELRWHFADILGASRLGEQDSITSKFSPEFRMWALCRSMPLVGGFYQRFPVYHTLAFRDCSILTSLHPHRLSRSQPSIVVAMACVPPVQPAADGVDKSTLTGPRPLQCSSVEPNTVGEAVRSVTATRTRWRSSRAVVTLRGPVPLVTAYDPLLSTGATHASLK
ncbi:hypothetical protein PR048_006109 [Dryococelus australis]|uniref:Uncharacterized protein n=1 Tax=Dryococelus australis TaxID=614101 RepID=A0ABQ9IB10_9NEOP|nr:hypothetical protein PR048_006109 [Dryococelus australis]